MKYIYTIVLLILLVPACTTIPLNQVIGAPTGLDIPHRRSGEFETLTTVHACSGGTLGVFNIESVAFDAKPLWSIYQYVGWYIYGEDTPFISTEFNEDGDIVSVELFGSITTKKELLLLYPSPCDAGRALITGKRI